MLKRVRTKHPPEENKEKITYVTNKCILVFLNIIVKVRFHYPTHTLFLLRISLFWFKIIKKKWK